jgi:glycosyltransferase involved in cell wall biosynthesis
VENPNFSPDSFQEADLYMMQSEGALVCGSHEFIVASEAYAQVAREQFLTDRKINVIPNGINTEEWNPAAGDGQRARMQHGIEGRPIALFVGRIATMKGIVPLLEALETTDPGYTTVISGEVNANTKKDADQWVVTQRIETLRQVHPERLRWVGFRHGQELRDLYAAANVVIMPSIHEPFGIVALEAMAMGVPLITTEVDGLGEIANGANGREYTLIIPSRNPKAILDALEVCKKQNIRDELRALGLERIKKYSWD